MEGQYKVGDKVCIDGTVEEVREDKDGTYYKVRVLNGKDWNDVVMVKEGKTIGMSANQTGR